jgi:hypothetical protein
MSILKASQPVSEAISICGTDFVISSLSIMYFLHAPAHNGQTHSLVFTPEGN